VIEKMSEKSDVSMIGEMGSVYSVQGLLVRKCDVIGLLKVSYL